MDVDLLSTTMTRFPTCELHELLVCGNATGRKRQADSLSDTVPWLSARMCRQDLLQEEEAADTGGPR
jgi:hypothetical protein